MKIFYFKKLNKTSSRIYIYIYFKYCCIH